MTAKLDRRLSTISDMITEKYDHIWDGCCDHGALGRTLLATQPATQIHFVDVVPTLITSLDQKLTRQFPDNPRWQTQSADLKQLLLPQPEASHLMIIAGVGGDLTIELVQNLLANNPNTHIEFILCPVRHHFKVRQAMKQLGLKLINEALTLERKLFYEVLHIGNNAHKEISVTGSDMWNLCNPEHQRYLEQTLQHYTRASRSKPKAYGDILAAYLALQTGSV
ncbi:MAG: tRNA (adenine(22)-N(1))-methyltransferase TrmK [Neptuniibacter sp.]